MAIKSEISWRRETPEGERVQVYARRFGGEWRFFIRHRRHEDWQPETQPPLEDWLALFDAVSRRVPRRLIPPNTLAELRQIILSRFPQAILPAAPS